MGRMADNYALVTRCLNDTDFQEIVFTGLLRAIFERSQRKNLRVPTGDPDVR